MKNKNLVLSIIINIFITVFEIIIGLFIKSYALISDAVHNFSDVGSMFLSLIAEKISGREATSKKSYGYKRIEILMALLNSVVLSVVVILILVESFQRLFHPEEVLAGYMFIVALVALIGNGLATYLLEKKSKQNLNMKSAWLHSMQDALFSLGVVIGAVVIHYTKWYIIDPLISIALSIYILKEVYGLIQHTLDILMESVPEHINFHKVKARLAEIKGIKSVADLHIWQTDSNSVFLSAHILIKEMTNDKQAKLLAEIQEILCNEFAIEHSTIQLASSEQSLHCKHCN